MHLTDQIKFTDGRLHETEIFGEAHTRFPFKSNPTPDRHARIHTRKFWIDPAQYVPKLTNRTSFTNLLASSTDFNATAWTLQSEVTRTPDSGANPWDGATLSVDRIVETAAAAEHILAGKAFAFSATPHCHWAILSPFGGRRYWRLLCNDGTTNFAGMFDLVAGKVKSTAGSGATAGLMKLDDGYFLIWLSFTPLAATGAIYLHSSSDGSVVSFAGSTSAGCYLAQMQLEAAAAPGPLIITAGASRSILAPDRDPEDIFAYLCAETDQGEYAGGLSAVQREFARIPRPQTTYPGRKFITKPDYTAPTAFNPLTENAENKGQASNFGDRALLGNASYAAASGLFTDGDNKIYYPMKVGGAQTPGRLTAGDFTIKRGGDTSATLNWATAGDADIAAAINAMTSVGAASMTVTVGTGSAAGLTALSALSGGALSIYVTGGSEADRLVPFEIDVSAATISNGVNEAATTVINSTHQQILLATKVTITAHGLNTGAALAAVWGNPTVFVYAPGEWGSVDSDNIWLPNWYNNGVAMQLAGNYSSTYSGPVSPAYTAGPRLPKRRTIDTYYLPGVSLGINSPDDIVITEGLQNPDTFLAALLAGLTGYQDYEPDGPYAWDLAPNQYVAEVTQIWFNEMV